MLIQGSELNNSLVMEIGKFTILWNCFERFVCDNNCNSNRIKTIASSIQIDQEKQEKLAKELKERSSLFDQISSVYVETGLHPYNARKSSKDDIKLMEEFIEQTGNDMKIGCLLTIYRIRNNMLHGLKIIEELNDQLNLFRAVNGVLESIR